MKTHALICVLALTACTHTTYPQAHDPDTIGEVLTHLHHVSESKQIPTNQDDSYTDEQTQLQELTIENIKLKQKINQLNQQLKQIKQPPAPPKTTPHKPKPRKAATHSTTTPMFPEIEPEEVPTLAQMQQHKSPDTLVQAQQYYRNSNYQAAIRTLQGADSGGDGSENARKRMYLLLLSHERLNNCQSVINIGQRLASRFSGSPEAAESLFLVGQCQWHIQQRDIAKDTWRKLIASHPNSNAAKRARPKLAQF